MRTAIATGHIRERTASFLASIIILRSSPDEKAPRGRFDRNIWRPRGRNQLLGHCGWRECPCQWLRRRHGPHLGFGGWGGQTPDTAGDAAAAAIDDGAATTVGNNIEATNNSRGEIRDGTGCQSRSRSRSCQQMFGHSQVGQVGSCRNCMYVEYIRLPSGPLIVSNVLIWLHL